MSENRHDYVVCNFANPDMVGHTGVLEAAVKAVETVDTCVGRVIAALDLERDAAIVTADHGNAELMIDPETGGPHTAQDTHRLRGRDVLVAEHTRHLFGEVLVAVQIVSVGRDGAEEFDVTLGMSQNRALPRLSWLQEGQIIAGSPSQALIGFIIPAFVSKHICHRKKGPFL